MRVTFVLSLLVGMYCCATGSAQQRSFKADAEGYLLELPSTLWRSVARPDGIHAHTDFFYGTDKNVRLRIRLELVDENTSPETVAARDEGRRLHFLPGFVDNKKEQFVGKLSGVKVTYEYVSGGKAVAARVYYLKANNRIIYVLRFTGTRAYLSQLNDQTDFIARSFHLK